MSDPRSGPIGPGADGSGSELVIEPGQSEHQHVHPRPLVTVVGLGPSGPELTTPLVKSKLERAEARFLRTARHPAALPWVETGVRTFDHHYENSESFDETYAKIVEDLVRAARESGEVVYAVPGSPSILEKVVALLRDDSRVDVVTLAGLSFLDLAWERLGIDPVNLGVRLVNGEEFALEASVERGPLLVSHTWSDAILSEMKLSIEPSPKMRAVICHHLGLEDEQIVEVKWDDLDRTIHADHLTCVYVPELARPPAYEIARAAEVVKNLRGLCPWDAKQTHLSLVRHLLEETYEAIEAIEELGDPPDIAASELLEEELGDILCQVLFHATIANEEGLFSLGDVAGALADKLIRRHPHVYAQDGDGSGDESAVGAEAVLANWEQQKLLEKGRASLTDGIPRALPALAYVAKLEKKMSTVGFGLADQLEIRAFDRVLDAITLEGADDYGELMLAVARRAVVAGHDPETALRRVAKRFREQFVGIEQAVDLEGGRLSELERDERIRRLRETKDDIS